ncbi:MAG: hypothetical protein AABW80_02845 [Nanoarchaeota archaeon]
MNKHRRAQKVKQGTNVTRRKFLRRGFGLAGGLCALSWAGLEIYQNRAEQPLSFVNIKESLEKVGYDDVVRLYVPLGERKDILPGMEEWAGLEKDSKSAIQQALRKWKFDARDKYKVVPSLQIYGIPLEKRLISVCLNHCKSAEEFLLEEVPEFEPVNINWTPVKKGDNFEEAYANRGFIAESYFRVQRMKVNGENNPSRYIMMGRTVHLSGGMGVGSTYGRRFIVVCAGESLVTTPFSEIIPINAVAKSIEHAEKAGEENASVARESFSESMSYLLGIDILKKRYGFSPEKAKEVINRIYYGSKNVGKGNYKDLHLAIKWAQKNGARAVYHAYMENPAKYVELINNN